MTTLARATTAQTANLSPPDTATVRSNALPDAASIQASALNIIKRMALDHPCMSMPAIKDKLGLDTMHAAQEHTRRGTFYTRDSKQCSKSGVLSMLAQVPAVAIVGICTPNRLSSSVRVDSMRRKLAAGLPLMPSSKTTTGAVPSDFIEGARGKCTRSIPTIGFDRLRHEPALVRALRNQRDAAATCPVDLLAFSLSKRRLTQISCWRTAPRTAESEN